MAIDSKGNNHQPKGTPNAGKFAPKGGRDGRLGPRRVRRSGPGVCPQQKEGLVVCRQGRYGGVPRRLPVEPVVMGDRDYGEAAAVRDTKDGYVVDLYSGLYPTMPLVSSDGYGTREEAERAARDAIASDNSVLNRFERESDYDDLRGRRHPVGAAGTAWGGRFVPKAGAGDGDMAAFRRSMTVEPSVMGGRDYGEAAAVEGDLGRDDTRMEPPGCMAVGEGWTLDPLSVSAANNQCRFTDDEGGILETQDGDWFDPNLGDCSSRRATYTSPRRDKVVAYDMKVDDGGQGGHIRPHPGRTEGGRYAGETRAGRTHGHRTGTRRGQARGRSRRPDARPRGLPHAGAAGRVPSVQGTADTPREPPPQGDGERLDRGRVVRTGTHGRAERKKEPVMESERIDTLVLPIEPKAAQPPRLDQNGSVWAATSCPA